MARGFRKAAKFVAFCDSFNIPILTLANSTRFAGTVCTENNMPEAASKFAYAYASATVPKVTVVAGKAFGSAYVLMGSKAMGADIVFAWPDSKIGIMDAGSAAKLLESDADKIAETKEAFDKLQDGVASAAQRGYVDAIISDADTRKYVIGAFEVLYTKRENRPDKKHGTV